MLLLLQNELIIILELITIYCNGINRYCVFIFADAAAAAAAPAFVAQCSEEMHQFIRCCAIFLLLAGLKCLANQLKEKQTKPLAFGKLECIFLVMAMATILNKI